MIEIKTTLIWKLVQKLGSPAVPASNPARAMRQLAEAQLREAQAEQNAEFNKTVIRRNKRFAMTGKNKHLRHEITRSA